MNLKEQLLKQNKYIKFKYRRKASLATTLRESRYNSFGYATGLESCSLIRQEIINTGQAYIDAIINGQAETDPFYEDYPIINYKNY